MYAKCDSGALNRTLPQTANNTYFLPGGTAQFERMCEKDGISLSELQQAGYERSSRFISSDGGQPTATDIEALGRRVLGMPMPVLVRR